VGYFSLLADGSSIDLGSNPHQLRFGRRLYIDYKTLTITGWQGTAGISGTGGQVYIVTSPFLAKSELEQIKFSFNSTWNNAAQLNTGELVVNTGQAAGNANIQFIAGLTKMGVGVLLLVLTPLIQPIFSPPLPIMRVLMWQN